LVDGKVFPFIKKDKLVAVQDVTIKAGNKQQNRSAVKIESQFALPDNLTCHLTR